MESTSYRSSGFNRMCLSRIAIAAILLIVGFLVGLLAGYFIRSSSQVDDSQAHLWATLTGSDLDLTVSKRLMDEIKPGNIQEHHRYMMMIMMMMCYDLILNTLSMCNIIKPSFLGVTSLNLNLSSAELPQWFRGEICLY